MKFRLVTLRTFVAVAVALLTTTASVHAYVVTIDPDEYGAGTNLSNVAPGATLSLFTNREEGWLPGAVRKESVYAVTSSYPSAPTGSLVFGGNPYGSRSTYFYNVLDGAPCISVGTCSSELFSVLRVDFERSTDYVEFWSGWDSNSPDGAFFVAFDRNNTRLVTCYGGGAGVSDRQIGDAAAWTLYGAGRESVCGSLIDIRNREDTGDGRYIADMYYSFALSRPQDDIAYVLWGAAAYDWSPNVVDRLSYRVRNVPEPGTLALLSLGLAGLGVSRRRRVT